MPFTPDNETYIKFNNKKVETKYVKAHDKYTKKRTKQGKCANCKKLKHALENYYQKPDALCKKCYQKSLMECVCRQRAEAKTSGFETKESETTSLCCQ